MRSRAALSLRMSGSFCGQAGPAASEIRIPSHGEGVRVGLNLDREQILKLNYKLSKNFENIKKKYLRKVKNRRKLKNQRIIIEKKIIEN